MSEIELRNENGKIVGYDSETGEKISVSFEALDADGLNSATFVRAEDDGDIHSIINAAGDGSTIVIYPGVYDESGIEIQNDDVTIRGVGATFTGGDGDSIFILRGTDTVGLTVNNLRFDADDSLTDPPRLIRVSNSTEFTIESVYGEGPAFNGVGIRNSTDGSVNDIYLQDYVDDVLDISGSENIQWDNIRGKDKDETEGPAGGSVVEVEDGSRNVHGGRCFGENVGTVYTLNPHDGEDWPTNVSAGSVVGRNVQASAVRFREFGGLMDGAVGNNISIGHVDIDGADCGIRIYVGETANTSTLETVSIGGGRIINANLPIEIREEGNGTIKNIQISDSLTVKGSGSGHEGVFVRGSTLGTIQNVRVGCRVYDTSSHGVFFRRVVDGSFTGYVEGSGGDGVHLFDCEQVNCSGATSNNNGERGFYERGESDYNLLQSCVCLGNQNNSANWTGANSVVGETIDEGDVWTG